jgi:uncharacterized membrane protein YoaK (UPF0700 family)
VVILTVASGSLDAVGFLRLGGVFTSVMTANMVLLGVSAGRRDAALALHAGAAFAGYIVGVFVGSRVAGRAVDGQPVWPRRLSVTLGFELALLAVFAGWWEASGGHPDGAATYGLLAVNATALGMQSAAVMRLGVSGLSTTYLTGTLTQLVANLRAGVPAPARRSLAILVALISGGALGALATIEAPRVVPVIPLGALALVLVGSHVAFGGQQRGPDPRP